MNTTGDIPATVTLRKDFPPLLDELIERLERLEARFETYLYSTRQARLVEVGHLESELGVNPKTSQLRERARQDGWNLTKPE